MPLDPSAALARYPANVDKLYNIALTRLPKMIDPATGLCVYRADGYGLRPSGTSVRYTAISALGVERAQDHGFSGVLDLDRLFEALSATIAGVDNAGDLGLILWAAARRSRPLAERALADLLEFKGNVRRRGGSTVGSTELAWIAIGLAEALAEGVGPEREVRARLDRAYRQLLDHRGESGLIGFARRAPGGRSHGIQRYFQESLGFFDAQVYAIVASLRRDAIIGDPEARAVARKIGEILLAHQRPFGQWAWHYNVRTGGLVDLYPVYSVHQDGMAPMALLMLEKALGVPTTAAVARGVDWFFGRNEIGELMAIPERNIIWRSIRRRAPFRSVRYPLKVASLLGLGEGRSLGARLAARSQLEIDRELRPYHLGFCLYAFAEIAAAARAKENGASTKVAIELGDVSELVQDARASNSV